MDSTADAGAPLVSVITVNHDGCHLLADLLESLRRQSYSNREVVVVDNASTDGSVDLLHRDFPEVRVLEQSENLGFAGGNNVGIRVAKGELIALANNDAVADPEWLEELVRTALEDPRIAAVGSKILFLRPFLPVRLAVENATRSASGRGRGSRGPGLLFGEETGFVGCDYDKAIFKEGFGGPELAEDRRVRRAAAEATVYLPIQATGESARLRLVVAGGELAPPRRLRVHVGASRVAGLALEERLREHLIDVPGAVVEAESFDLINNAGTALSASGEAADRGIFEPDHGQYDREEDLEAICGAAVLFRRSALEEVGLFDRDFFMYYEDTDLSWRLRRRGFRLRYQPRSTIRHQHAATSVEWSPLFTFYTARNRILMIVKNGGPGAFLSAYARELGHLLRLLARRWRGRHGPEAQRIRRELATRLRVQGSLVIQIPRAVLKRAGLVADRDR
jgi:O-antigen biosynthesis protein